MINFIDTHIHLDLLDNFSNVIQYVENNKIYVIAMTNHPKVYETLINKIDSKFIRVALGMHPELVKESNFTLFKKYVDTTKYIGEVGLDFSKKNEANLQKQIKIFTDILCVSKHKILSIHSRKAETEVLNCIENNFDKDSSYILHWYTGGEKDLLRAINLGCYFSININMVKSKKFLENAHLIPKEKILVETDAPFSQGSIFNLENTYNGLSQAIKVSKSCISEQVFNNFKDVLLKSK